MNYKKLYNKIIKNRKVNRLSKSDGYCESHHVIPKSLGGDNSKNNLVNLTAREHFICHYLLTKIYINNSNCYYKMLNAFMLMKANSTGQKRYINSRLYNYAKNKLSKEVSCRNINTIMITNGKKTKRIKKSDIIPYNWVRGVYRKNKDAESDNTKLVEKYTSYYNLYVNSDGWDDFVCKTNYKYSRSILNDRFRKYVKDYKYVNIDKIKMYEYLYEIFKKNSWHDFVLKTGYKRKRKTLLCHFKKYVRSY